MNKQRAKVSGMCDFPNSSYTALKIIVFSMETPCWSPSEGLQHGGVEWSLVFHSHNVLSLC